MVLGNSWTIGGLKLINGIELYKLNEKTKLHVVNSTKFKTDLIGIYLKRPLNKAEVTKNTLITRLLGRATTEHKTSQDLNTYLEELYGAILVPDVVKYGDTQVLGVIRIVHVVHEAYLSTPGMWRDNIGTSSVASDQ